MSRYIIVPLYDHTTAEQAAELAEELERRLGLALEPYVVEGTPPPDVDQLVDAAIAAVDDALASKRAPAPMFDLGDLVEIVASGAVGEVVAIDLDADLYGVQCRSFASTYSRPQLRRCEDYGRRYELPSFGKIAYSTRGQRRVVKCPFCFRETTVEPQGDYCGRCDKIVSGPRLVSTGYGVDPVDGSTTAERAARGRDDLAGIVDELGGRFDDAA